MIKSIKRVCFPFFVLCIILSLTQLYPQQTKPKVVVMQDKAPLRISQSADSPIIKKIPQGEILEVEWTGWEWLKVKLPKDESGISLIGYINVKFISYEIDKAPKLLEKKEIKIPIEIQPKKPVAPPVLPPKKKPVKKKPMIKKKKEPISIEIPKKILSFYGGFAWENIHGGDLNKLIRDTNLLYSDSNNYYNYIDYVSQWSELKWLNNLRGEIIVYITPKIGIGFGVDNFFNTSLGTLTENRDTEETVNTGLGFYYVKNVDYALSKELEYKLRIMPVSLTLHLSVPLTNILTAIFSGGIGYYFGNLEITDTFVWNDYLSEKYYFDDGTFWKERTDKEDRSGIYSEKIRSKEIGFHGGVGIDLKMTRNISFVMEGIYRITSLKNWEGNFTNIYTWNTESGWSDAGVNKDSGNVDESGEGSSWYREIYYDFLSKYYANMNVLSSAPIPGVGIRGIRLARIILNGLSLRWGIKISI